jgi:hypothetical protein
VSKFRGLDHTTEFHGGEYGEGKDDAGGNLGLGVVLVAHCLEGVVYLDLRGAEDPR